MDGYDGTGVEDDRVAQAARRIVRQYHLERGGGDDGIAPPAPRPAGAPDDIHVLRLAIDGMAVRVDQVQRLMAHREALFLATLESVDRNLAHTDGRLDALAAEVARIDARPAITTDMLRAEQRDVVVEALREQRDMLTLGRTLLDEVRGLHAAGLVAAGGNDG